MNKALKTGGLAVSIAAAGFLVSELPLLPIKSSVQAQDAESSVQAQDAESSVQAQDVTTLDSLLAQVRQRRTGESAENNRRVNEFRSQRNRQQQLLDNARADIKREEQISEQLEATFNENELELGELEIQLAERLGAFGELFGVARQVSGDTRGQVDNSLVSAQFPGRSAILNEIATSKVLPTIEQLQDLWFFLQQEMTEQGKVVKFNTTVTDTDGNPQDEAVTRIGPFTAVADGGYLSFDPTIQELKDLQRQPAGSFTGVVDDLEEASEGEVVRAAIDPSSGAILGLLVQTPNIFERINQGGTVGYIVIGLAVLGLLIGFERIFTLTTTAGAVRRQARDPDRPRKGNPLGRVLMVYEENRDADVETLELKLDDAILKEIPKLERGLNTVKVLAGVAPLLGLLGTVTGMIITFQAITLFGTGDPKLMAGGISQALVTTVLGLVAAIPLLLLHSFAAGRARTVQQILEEQSAGLIAASAEGS